MNSAPLVVTAGEPSGIGPDLCIALAEQRDLPPFVVVGDADTLATRADRLSSRVTVVRVAPHELSTSSRGRLPVVDLPYPAAVECGRPDSANAAVLLDGLRLAVDGCRDGRFRALVTAPVAKRVIADAGFAFSGHTEFLADLTNTELPVMLLVAGDLRVALATTHLPLRDVPAALTRDRLRQVLRIVAHDLRHRFGIDAPRIVVCGLNPHAGEGGYLGNEDADVITPVVAELAAAGVDAIGPVPADTAFTPAVGERDVVVAMYHDQGLPVLKYAGFGRAVNVTLGLPIVRTSVDHGTAFDLAGSGRADAGSLVEAVRLAAWLTERT